jgi:gluconokinase
MTGDTKNLHLVVMGVSGSGKSVIGSALAEALGADFIDADDLHPESNRSKMASGIPLTDEDRWPWLEKVGDQFSKDQSLVIACSALKKIYRDRIREHAPDAKFLLLEVPENELQTRMQARTDHFMPPSLLKSQLDLLEKLGEYEDGITVSNEGSVEDVVKAAIDSLQSLKK